jgi:hypothetical protein
MIDSSWALLSTAASGSKIRGYARSLLPQHLRC